MTVLLTEEGPAAGVSGTVQGCAGRMEGLVGPGVCSGLGVLIMTFPMMWSSCCACISAPEPCCTAARGVLGLSAMRSVEVPGGVHVMVGAGMAPGVFCGGGAVFVSPVFHAVNSEFLPELFKIHV